MTPLRGVLLLGLACASCQLLLDSRPPPVATALESADAGGAAATDSERPVAEAPTGPPSAQPMSALEETLGTPALQLPAAARPGLGSVEDVVAGFDHTCALLDTGQVRCWGSGLETGYADSGSIVTGEDVGDDERPASAGFVDLGGPAKQISAGLNHTCALLDSGAVRCWGSSYTGELGYGNADSVGDDETPASAGDVDVGGSVREIVAGSQATCALLHDGGLRCWGLRYAGASEATAAEPENFSRADYTGPPTPIPATLSPIDLRARVVQIGIGAEHSCALLGTGSVRCWGNGADGRLGYGNVDDIDDPTAAGDVEVGGRVLQLAVGPSQTCAVLEDGKVRCWGLGVDGRLGYGNTNSIGDDELPVAAGDVDVGGPVRSLGLQGSLVCALLESGAVRCWGPGYGFHPSPAASSEPAGVADAGVPEIWCSFTDSRVSVCPGYVGALGYGVTGTIGDDETPATFGDLRLGGAVRKLAVGGNHACALLETGSVQCWGQSSRGQLGHADRQEIGDDETPDSAGFVDVAGSPIEPIPPTAALSVSVGESHSCAILDGGSLRCWGNASAGQLGYGNKHDIGDDEEPRAAGDVELRGVARQVSAGAQHTCAVLDGGAVKCWGSSAYGALGYGDSRDIGIDDVPASFGYVDVGGAVRQIAATAYETCAVLLDGALRCWGIDAGVQLGSPEETLGDDEAPSFGAHVDVGGSVRQVALGYYQTCVLLESGGVRCWGIGSDGVVGYGLGGPVERAPTPAGIAELDLGGRATQLSLSADIACALLDDGGVRCWSTDPFVLIDDPLGTEPTDAGAGAEPAAPGPTRIDLGEGNRAVQIAVGAQQGCAVLESGAVRCWQSFYVGFSDFGPPSTEEVELGTTAREVAVGSGHSCAVLTTGGVRCWGYGEQGELGYPTILDVAPNVFFGDPTAALLGDVPLF